MAPNHRKQVREAATQVAAAPPPGSIPVQAPQFFASSFQTALAGNSAMLLLLHPVPLTSPASGAEIGFAAMTPSAIVQLPITAAKDLAIIMAEMVENYEREWGPIVTEFTRRRGE